VSFSRSLRLLRPLAVLLLAACAADSPSSVAPTGAVARRGSDDGGSGGETGGGGSGSGSTSGTPTFVSAGSSAPAIANPVVSFYAKVGEDRSATMWYAPRPGRTDSTVFLRFRVRPRSLAYRPDGTRFAAGDSVLITITLVDPAHLGVDCQPSGLRFSSSDPADMKLSFAEADEDVNGDGVVDRSDTDLTRRFAIWRRELSTDPWIRQPSSVDVGLHEIESEILGFSSYIVAY
jgi:hypothetical protein